MVSEGPWNSLSCIPMVASVLQGSRKGVAVTQKQWQERQEELRTLKEI